MELCLGVIADRIAKFAQEEFDADLIRLDHVAPATAARLCR